MNFQDTSSIVSSNYEQRWIDGLNKGDVSVADEIFHPDCIIHINGNPHRDLLLTDFKQMLTGFLIAFPDLHFTMNDQFSSGEKYCTRWTATGTNSGPMGEMKPTGKPVEIEGHIIDYLEDGKVIKRYELWDQMGMFQQLGLA